MSEYNIYNTSGSKVYEVKEATLESNKCPIWFVGHGLPDYGEAQNTNFLRMLEHYCHTEEPNKPIIGQIWYKQLVDDGGNLNGKYELRVCRNPDAETLEERWDKLPHLVVPNPGQTEPTDVQNGDIWYDFSTHSLKVYDNNQWNLIGPEDSEHLKHMFFSQTITQIDSTSRYIMPKSLFAYDVNNDGDTKPSAPQGSLNLIEIKILIKEIYDGTGYADGMRCHASKHTVVLQANKTGASDTQVVYKVRMLNAPIEEILAKSDDFNFVIQIYWLEQLGQLIVEVTPDGSGTLSANTHCVVGYDVDISRI